MIKVLTKRLTSNRSHLEKGKLIHDLCWLLDAQKVKA
jgi:hypothetical protein